jgi:hypothetical protein
MYNSIILKDLLVEKLEAENCYFTKKDISISSVNNKHKIVVKDYEFCPFEVTYDNDEFFEHCVTVWNKETNTIIHMAEGNSWEDSQREAMLYLGYYIGTRF